MSRQQIAFAFILVYSWTLIILVGTNLFETLIMYPNIFHDVPQSLQTTMEFMVVAGPGDFFRTVGFIALLTGIGSLVLSWGQKPTRGLILASAVIIFFGEFILSMTYFWPRNTIMFTEGTEIHSATFLQQTAQEFQTGHWLRLALSIAVSVLSFIGLLKFYHYSPI